MKEPYYNSDGITIYNTDCRDILPSIEPKAVDLVLTDPPYGIKVKTDYGKQGRGRRAQGRNHAPIFGDDAPFDPAVILPFGRCVLWGANNYANRLPDSQSWIVWDRQTGEADAADAELAWSNPGGTVRMFKHLWCGVLRDSEIGWHVHPTQKPVALMRWILTKWTKPGDLILDPYM